MAALAAIEMRVRLVMGIGSHAVEKSATAAADAFGQSVGHQEVQDAIDRYAVYRRSGFQCGENFLGAQRAVMVADNFQNFQSVLSDAQARRLQQRRIITSKAHIGILRAAAAAMPVSPRMRSATVPAIAIA